MNSEDDYVYDDELTLPKAIRLLGLEIIANIIKDARSNVRLTMQNNRRREDKEHTVAIQEARDWIYLDEHKEDRQIIADMAGLEYDYMMRMIIREVNSTGPSRPRNRLHIRNTHMRSKAP